MTIYVSHSREFDFEKELYEPIRSANFFKNHTFIFPHEEGREEPYPTKQFFQSGECDLILAEVSYPSTGQGIELGWADLLNIPIICHHKDGMRPSQSLSLISSKLIMYTDTSDLIHDIEGVFRHYETEN